MVSFRAASDEAHITQLLGRMVRSPHARRIPGYDRLNSVDYMLPHFNQQTVMAVVNALITGGESGEDARLAAAGKPLGNATSPDVPEDVWDKLTSLPSQALPKKQAKPVRRLTLLLATLHC